MLRALPVLLGLVVVLSAGLSTPVDAQAPIVVRALVGKNGRVISDTMGTRYELAHPPGRVFAALAEVYADLKVETSLRDSAQLQIGNESFIKRGALGGRRMSAVLDCGVNMAGPRADSYRIDIGMVSFVTAVGPNAAIMRTAFLGTALDVGEAARPTVACYTMGAMERRVLELVTQKLQRAPSSP